MRKSLGFTLAEVLITLAIIGVVAAMTIPSVIVSTNQQEFKTGLKKAVSTLNQAITMNAALENMSPKDVRAMVYTNDDSENGVTSLMTFFTNRLNILKKVDQLSFGGSSNAAFYTSDGMRFEFPTSATTNGIRVYPGASSITYANNDTMTGGCSVEKPCLVVVDVNGDKKPNPESSTSGAYTVPAADSSRIGDVFTLMITDTAAVPLGATAQRTMFQND